MSDAASHEARAELLRRNWALPIAGFAMALAGAAYERFGNGVVPIGWFAVPFGVVLALATLKRDAFPRRTPIVAHATPAALAIGDESIAKDDIEQAKIVPYGADAKLVLVLRSRGTRALRLGAADAAAILRVLGLAAGARRTTFDVMLPYGWRFLTAFLVLGVPWIASSIAHGAADHGPAPILMGIAFFVVPVAAFVAWIAGAWRGRVVVASDGFTLRWFRKARFIPFADVTIVRADAQWAHNRGVTTFVGLRSGHLRLRPPDAPVTDDDLGVEGRALFEHIHAAHLASQARSDDALHVAALLGRGERSGQEWLAQIDALVRGGEARYRVAAPAPDVLARIAADASCPADVRVGAAAALVRLDAEGRRAVRVAADACAEPRVHDAFVALGDATSDEAIASVLERAGAK